jgi:hypothetical protein
MMDRCGRDDGRRGRPAAARDGGGGLLDHAVTLDVDVVPHVEGGGQTEELVEPVVPMAAV